MKALLDIVIINWNSGQCLSSCLRAISATDLSHVVLSRVVVVDNASSDHSLGGLEACSLPLRVVHNEENRGFAAACNQGAGESKADYLLFLNPDTRLRPDSLNWPVSLMQDPRNRDVGIVGIQLVGPAGEVSRSCARFPTPLLFFSEMLGLNRLSPRHFPSHFMTRWSHRESRLVDHVVGAFFLVRRHIFETLGGFDERFFVYLEDLDFSLRARQAGWRSFYLAEAQAFHEGGGASKQVKALRLFYSLRSRILYAHKHFGLLSATLVTMGTLLVEPFTRLVLAASRFSCQETRNTVRAYCLLYRALPATLRTAWSMRSNSIQ